ncbi:MAG TPA: ABC transporter permease [Candidatus Limnocylindrales bacterium]|nr:ABC transporter permease [Candidatus Limnocylindrales bacterium]
MKQLRRLWGRLRGLRTAEAREHDMRQEFESHMEMHIADNIRGGMSPDEARREAALKFGGMETAKESVREESRLLWLETAWLDLRYAVRGLRLNPGFAAAAILSLALGIGATIAIFTVADNLLLRSLPYPDPSKLVMIYEKNNRLDVEHNVVAPADYFDWKAQSSSFSAMGGFFDYQVVFGDGKHSEEIDAQAVTGEVLPLLGAKAVRGRVFTPDEDSDKAYVAVISYRLWQSWFGGDESIIGRTVQVNARPFTVVGVLSPDFYFHTRSTGIWLTLGLKNSPELRSKLGRWLLTVARIKPDASLRQARTEMAGIARRIELEHPETNKNWSVNVEPLRESLVGKVRTQLLILLGAVTLLLAVACANVANLLLARYTARTREIAVRGALGATPGRLVRQLLTESIVLAVTGGALGLALACLAVNWIVALAPKELTQSVEVTFDSRIVIFSCALALMTSAAFGLAPAVLAMRRDLNHALHEESRTSTGTGHRFRNWLVVGEIACSVALLAGAGLLLRSMIGLENVNPGLDAGDVLTFRVSVPKVRYPTDEKITQFFADAVQRMAQLPGVRSASAVSYLPFNGMAAATDVIIGGRPPAKPGEGIGAVVRTVLPDYFRTMGIPITHGRDFTYADDLTSAPHRFVVNEAFARKNFPREPVLGKQISVYMADQNPMGEIIGVVGDVKEGALDQEPTPTVYYIHSHLAYSQMVFVLRTQSDPLALAAPARRILQSLDPELPISDLKTMGAVIRLTYARQQFSTVLLAGFSLTALVLAAIGIYGLLAYSVVQRTREIAVRVALGAEPPGIIRMVVGNGVRLAIAGTIVGLGGALIFSGVMKSMLYEISPRDPLAFTAAPAVLFTIALLASYLPARRAAKVSPMEALRNE